MNALYDWLVENKIKKISDHELSCWPQSESEELKAQARLIKAENADHIYCDGCEDSCPIGDYDIIEVPEKGKMAAFVCPEKEEMGLITVPLSRRRYWHFVRPKRRKRISEVHKNTASSKEPIDLKKACFVILPDGIGFYSDREFKKLPFQADSHVLEVLPMFLKGSMTSQEIKKYAQSTDSPRSIVKNMNKSILSRIHLAGFTHIKNKKFIYFDRDTYSYKTKLTIITQEQYDDLIRPLES